MGPKNLQLRLYRKRLRQQKLQSKEQEMFLTPQEVELAFQILENPQPNPHLTPNLALLHPAGWKHLQSFLNSLQLAKSHSLVH